MGSGCFPPISATVVGSLPSRGSPQLTEEFSRVSRGEGRPQDRAQHHVQLEFLPLGDELGAVHLGEERGMSIAGKQCSPVWAHHKPIYPIPILLGAFPSILSPPQQPRPCSIPFQTNDSDLAQSLNLQHDAREESP